MYWERLRKFIALAEGLADSAPHRHLTFASSDNQQQLDHAPPP